MSIAKRIFNFVIPVVLLGFLFIDFAAGAEKTSGLVAPGAILKTVQSGFQGTEGPATDTEGNVYFTDVFAEQIYKWTWKDGKVTLYREKTGMANGMMFDGKGNLVICEMGNGRITRDDLKGNVTVIADSLNGKKMRGPNDLWIDPKGGIYISHTAMGREMLSGGMPGGAPQGGGASGSSAPGKQTDGQAPAGEMAGGPGRGASVNVDKSDLGILYISPDGRKVTLVTTDVTGPNGLIGTPDGKTLYVGDNDNKKIWSYKINPDGALTDKKLFCEKMTDGMAMDEKNNVYITNDKSVLAYSPAGKLLEEIALPQGCSNVEFCGKDRKTLFITYRGYIYTLEMAVKGAQLPIDTAGIKR